MKSTTAHALQGIRFVILLIFGLPLALVALFVLMLAYSDFVRSTVPPGKGLVALDRNIGPQSMIEPEERGCGTLGYCLWALGPWGWVPVDDQSIYMPVSNLLPQICSSPIHPVPVQGCPNPREPRAFRFLVNRKAFDGGMHLEGEFGHSILVEIAPPRGPARMAEEVARISRETIAVLPRIDDRLAYFTDAQRDQIRAALSLPSDTPLDIDPIFRFLILSTTVDDEVRDYAVCGSAFGTRPDIYHRVSCRTQMVMTMGQQPFHVSVEFNGSLLGRLPEVLDSVRTILRASQAARPFHEDLYRMAGY